MFKYTTKISVDRLDITGGIFPRPSGQDICTWVCLVGLDCDSQLERFCLLGDFLGKISGGIFGCHNFWVGVLVACSGQKKGCC